MRTRIAMWGFVATVVLSAVGCGDGGEDPYEGNVPRARRDGGLADGSGSADVLAQDPDAASPDPDAAATDPDGGTTRGSETCGNGFDDNGDGRVDEDCACLPATTQVCYTGPRDVLGRGICRAGMQTCQGSGEFGRWGDCVGSVTPRMEQCGNGVDDNCDGVVDEGGCVCAPGATRACYSGAMSQIGRGRCRAGTQTCNAMGTGWSPCSGEVGPTPEICGNNIDEDCDGVADNGCTRICNVMVSLDGDCLTTSCPADCPYPVGCDITMAGGDSRGCVASTPTGRTVYFQEGDACGAGHVTGVLRCSNVPGAGLTEATCRINKPTRYYPRDRSGCPRTSG